MTNKGKKPDPARLRRRHAILPSSERRFEKNGGRKKKDQNKNKKLGIDDGLRKKISPRTNDHPVGRTDTGAAGGETREKREQEQAERP